MKHTRLHIYRSSKTGQIVTESFAKKHPATTERETVYRPSPKRG